MRNAAGGVVVVLMACAARGGGAAQPGVGRLRGSGTPTTQWVVDVGFRVSSGGSYRGTSVLLPRLRRSGSPSYRYEQRVDAAAPDDSPALRTHDDNDGAWVTTVVGVRPPPIARWVLLVGLQDHPIALSGLRSSRSWRCCLRFRSPVAKINCENRKRRCAAGMRVFRYSNRIEYETGVTVDGHARSCFKTMCTDDRAVRRRLTATPSCSSSR